MRGHRFRPESSFYFLNVFAFSWNLFPASKNRFCGLRNSAPSPREAFYAVIKHLILQDQNLTSRYRYASRISNYLLWRNCSIRQHQIKARVKLLPVNLSLYRRLCDKFANLGGAFNRARNQRSLIEQALIDRAWFLRQQDWSSTQKMIIAKKLRRGWQKDTS